MPKVTDIGFIGSAYIARSKQIDCQECVNLYPELEQQSSKNVIALLGTPGKKRFATVTGAGGCRGFHFTASGRAFAVVGSSVVELYQDGTWTRLGSLLSVLGAVGMADNGTQGQQLLIVDGVAGYIYDLSDKYGLSQIKDGPWTAGVAYSNFTDGTISSFPAGATHAIFKDGWFLVNRSGTGQFFLSNLYDGTMWNPTYFATAEGSPDNLTAMVKTTNEVWLFGLQSAEVWFTTSASIPSWIDISQTPAANFPFSRIPNAFLDIGTEAPRSVAAQGNDIFWLGGNNLGHGIVWHAQGYQPDRISTHGIEYIISEMSRTDDAVGYCYQQEGHFFYVLNFPTANRTLVFDQSTNMWHERQTYNEAANKGGRDRGICHVYAFGKHLVGDFHNGNIYELNLDTYTDDGAKMQAIRSSPHVHADMNRIFYNKFELDCEKGPGTIKEIVRGATTAIVSDDFQTYGDGDQFTGGTKWDVVAPSAGALWYTAIVSTKKLVYYGRTTQNGDTQCLAGYVSPKAAAPSDCEILTKAIIVNPVAPGYAGTNFNKLSFELRRTGQPYTTFTPTEIDADLTCYRITVAALLAYQGVLVPTWTLEKVRNNVLYSVATGALPFDLSHEHSYLASVSGTNPVTIRLAVDGVQVFSHDDSILPILSSDTCAVGADQRSESILDNHPYVLISEIAITSTPYTDTYRAPQAMLSWSDDGGFTWSGERWVSMGKIGEYKARLNWNRLGSSRNRVFKVVISDPVKRALIAARVTLESESV